MKLTDTPSTPEYLAQSEEERAFLRSLADDFCQEIEAFEQRMAKKFDDQLFDLDEGNALWSLLPAKVRTAITRGRSATPSACSQCGGQGSHTRHCPIGGRFK